ncbi:MAG: hypothetical protein ACREDH_07360 [Methylocella sp.]
MCSSNELIERKGVLREWIAAHLAKKPARIVTTALARKLLIALWRYAKDGVILERAKMKMA